jgi:hypothetical protein
MSGIQNIADVGKERDDHVILRETNWVKSCKTLTKPHSFDFRMILSARLLSFLPMSHTC